MTSGGASRTTVPCVSFDSTPLSSSRWQTSRALAWAGSISAPAQRPRPRTAFSAGIADGAQAREHVLAEHAAALHQPFVLDDAQRFEADRGGERIAAEGRAVRARREHVHQLRRPTKADTGSTPPPNALPRMRPSGNDAFVLEGEPGAGAAEPRLHLVEDQEHAVGIAQRPDAREIALRRNDDAGLALDRLDQHGGGLGRDRARPTRRDRRTARRGSPARTGRNRPVLGFRREADDGRGAAVEVALRDDDLGAIAAMPLTR